MNRHILTHAINYPAKAWLIFHDSQGANEAALRIDGVRNYQDARDGWGGPMRCCISTSACIICKEHRMGTWNIFRPREAKFLIDYPLDIHENVDEGIVSFSADASWCPFCNLDWHPRQRCPILADMLHRIRGDQYECYRCFSINHHHHENCRFPVVRGASRIAEVRRQQQYNIGT